MTEPQATPVFNSSNEEPATDAAVTYAREDRTWADAAPDVFEDDVVLGRDEAELAHSVLSALRLDSMLDARQVRVFIGQDRSVVLAGKVADASDRALAGLIARRQPGVARIENRLEVEEAIHEGSIWPHGVDHVETSSERFAGLRKSS